MAIEWGIPADKYWSLTFGEIMLQVSANKKRKLEESKEKAMFDYNLAQLVAFAFNKPEKMPKPEAVYSILKEEDEPKQNLVSQDVLESTYNPTADQDLFLQIAKGVKRYKESETNGGE